MANNTHVVFNGTHAAFWDVDSYNLCGICVGADIDNGTFLTLGEIGLKNDGGYEFAVTAGQNADLIAGTPPQGYGIDAQVYDDPRYFTNVAGKPISVKRLVKGDFIELTVGAFTADPSTNGYAKVEGAGKLTAQSDNTDADFQIVGTRTMDIGGEFVPTWVLMKLA